MSVTLGRVGCVAVLVMPGSVSVSGEVPAAVVTSALLLAVAVVVVGNAVTDRSVSGG